MNVPKEVKEKIMELTRATLEGDLLTAADYKKLIRIPEAKRILKSGNRTIVFWSDGTKTIVKRAEDEAESDYAAFTAALGIKLYGSNSALKRIVARTETQKKEATKKRKTIPTCDGCKTPLDIIAYPKQGGDKALAICPNCGKAQLVDE